jgi:hypothetical protein
MVLFSSNIGNVLWVMLAVSLVMPYVLKWRRRRRYLREEQKAAVREGGEA